MNKRNLLCILILLLASSLMYTQKVNTEILTGMDNSKIVGDTIQLERETYNAFIKMKDAAEKDGIKIKLVSGFRDFYRQQTIWNNKYKKFTEEFLLDGPSAIQEIIRFSTIPGKVKDYISTPKINNYKSIHTAVVGPKKNRIEIQIRTHEMHEFAQRGIASHWKYKSSEKFSELSWKEYDWLRDLVEIIEAGTSPEHYYEFTKLQMFQENVFCFTPKGAVIKLPKNATPIDFAYAVHTKIGNSATGCTVNGRSSTLQTILKNGDLVSIETSKNASPSLHWLSSSATGKARSAIRRYWQDKSTESLKTQEKNYSSTIEVDLPHKPGVLGHITSLIGLNKGNIVNLEIIKRNKEHLTFSFDLQIKDLKNFTNLISQIKQSNLRFKIIRHKQKKNAFIRRIFENFKRN